jgi:membrane-bound lytic murein transglycosylase B
MEWAMGRQRALVRLGAAVVAALAVAPLAGPTAASARASRPPSSTTSSTSVPEEPSTTTTTPPPTAPTVPAPEPDPGAEPETEPEPVPTGPVGPASLGAPITSGGVAVGDTLGLVDPSLAGVPVEAPELRAADAALRAAESGIEDADAAVAAADAAIRAADVAIAGTHEEQRRGAEEVARREQVERDVLARIDRLSAKERGSTAALAASRRRLQELAVASYVAGDDVTAFDAFLSAQDSSEYGRRTVFAEMADTRLREQIGAYRSARDRSRRAIAETEEQLARARRETAAARQALAEAVAAEAAWQTERGVRVAARDEWLAERERRVAERERRVADRAEATVMAWVVGADFPLVVLDAYQRAALRAGRDGCAIPWTALAGIGRVESRHGTYLGATVDDHGRVAPPIIGIPLTGANGTAAISDTDGGHFDGDPVHDRAVGPMQFIPSTWRAYGLDGDGEGTTDPQNLYDAAAAAANYLCRSAGGRVDTDASMTQAFLAYNHSDAYARLVLSYAKAYAALRLPVG